MRDFPAIPSAVVDSVPLRRMFASLARRILGRSKRRHRHGSRFEIERDSRAGRVSVRDRATGRLVSIESPLHKDAFTALDVFTNQAYTLAQTAYAPVLEQITRDGRPEAPRPLVIDAGANIGASSLLFSMLFPRGTVIAIEPDPRNVELLTRNCSAAAGVRIVTAAIGATDGSAMLDSASNPRSSRVCAEGTIRVDVVSINALLARAPEYLPLMLKIDIEGAEQELFSGDCGWIDRFPIISMEPHDWKWPGCGITKPFLAQIASRQRDLLVLGPNLVSVDGVLLRRNFGLDVESTNLRVERDEDA